MRSAQAIVTNDLRAREARNSGGNMGPQGFGGIDARFGGVRGTDFTQHGRMAQPFGFNFYRDPNKFTGFGTDGFINPYPRGVGGLGEAALPDSSIEEANPPLITPALLGAYAGAALGGALLGWVISGRQAAVTGAIMNMGLLSLGTLVSRPASTPKTLLFGGATALAALHVYRRRFR